jgi:hypothetical protein
VGAGFEVVTGTLSTSSLTAGTYAAYVANTGQSFAIRQSNGSPSAELLAPWAQSGVAGFVQIKSPRMHDTTIGITEYSQISTGTLPVDPLEDELFEEPMFSTDTLTVQFTPAATISSAKVMCVALPIYYSSIDGIQENLLTWAQIQGLINVPNKVGDHYVSWVVPSSAATAGAIGTGVAINATNDQFKAGHSYALLGVTLSAQCSAVLIQGTDTSGVYVGAPGTLNNNVGRNYFVDQAVAQNLAMVPVVQANNKANTFVYIVDGQTTSTAFTVGLHWMDLGLLNTPAAA